MVTRNTPCLVIDIISDEVVKITFYYRVWIGIYSVWLITIDTHPEVVKNILSITITGNITVYRWVVPVITILFLGFVMIH